MTCMNAMCFHGVVHMVQLIPGIIHLRGTHRPGLRKIPRTQNTFCLDSIVYKVHIRECGASRERIFVELIISSAVCNAFAILSYTLHPLSTTCMRQQTPSNCGEFWTAKMALSPRGILLSAADMQLHISISSYSE